MLKSISAWSPEVRVLTKDQVRVLAESNLVNLEIHEPPESWKVVPNSKVGIVEGDGWSFQVKPRIPIPRLMFLLGYAIDPKGWKQSLSAFAAEDLFSAVANGFSTLAIRALEPSPLRGYTQVDDRSTAFRGRIRMEDQIARTMPFPFEISFDNHTIDIPENRAILAAAELLLRFPRVPTIARKRLLRIRAELDGVQARLAPSELIATTRLNEHYESALRLASLILKNQSASAQTGSYRSASFIFDMNKVFEDFLAESLSDTIRRNGGHARLQYGDRYLDHQRKIKLVPDIVWMEKGKPRAVIDAKFKEIKYNSFPNADAYQALAYCTGLSVRSAFLVYARDSTETNRDHDLVGTSASIKVRHLDLALEPDDLLSHVDLLATEIKSTLSDPKTATETVI